MQGHGQRPGVPEARGSAISADLLGFPPGMLVDASWPVAAALSWSGKPNRSLSLECVTTLLMVALFAVPYFLGGGDWFPPYWARYAMPLVMVTIVLSFIATQRIWWIGWGAGGRWGAD